MQLFGLSIVHSKVKYAMCCCDILLTLFQPRCLRLHCLWVGMLDTMTRKTTLRYKHEQCFN